MKLPSVNLGLFSTAKKPKDITNVPTPSNHARMQGESYRDYGFRLAGLSAGSIFSLPPCFQSVYLGLKTEQQKDFALQQKLQNELKSQKAKLEQERDSKQGALKNCKDKQQSLAKNIKELQEKLTELANSQYVRNKSAWHTLIVSAVILIPFTIYLFVFYSSVAYSAFFKEFSTSSLDGSGDFKLSQAIFDSSAFSNAWNDGIGELMFILFMPIIFLAFGFVLNRWERESGKLKYLKIPLLIVIAFIFDSLLSYEICEKIYNLNAMMSLEDVHEYSMSLAVNDPRFWVILFLGFVAYLIWGFVFGYLIKAWEELDLNQIKKKELENKEDELKRNLEQEKKSEQVLDNDINQIRTQINDIDSQMSHSTRYDLSKIRLELNNFFSGWQHYLAALNVPNDQKADAQKQFNSMLDKITT